MARVREGNDMIAERRIRQLHPRRTRDSLRLRSKKPRREQM
jgi:hypothetical protein